MDYLFDEVTNGRRIETLVVVDVGSQEAVSIAADTTIPAP